ncbi:MAG: NfeD family protein [Guyparkeria sp.]|uniref:NfeD family protein n=1 Tax=Guyparkeria sp. TaxID=2035736 RepID=UPI00397C367C
MEGFSPAWAWAVIGLVLALAELLTGAFVLLALGVAALITALLSALTGMGLVVQLVVMGIASGILVPLAIYRIRPMFSPRGVKYGTTGAGSEAGKTFTVEPMRFDPSLPAIRVNGDQYRIQPVDEHERPSDRQVDFGQHVQLLRFEGTIALVRPSD